MTYDPSSYDIYLGIVFSNKGGGGCRRFGYSSRTGRCEIKRLRFSAQTFLAGKGEPSEESPSWTICQNRYMDENIFQLIDVNVTFSYI